MTGIIIVTHGKLAQALLGTVEMIMGLQERIGAIGFEAGQTVADLQEQLCQMLQKNAEEDEALILVDLQGGSPYNAAALLAMTMPKVKVVTGVNLPMLLGVLPSRDLAVTALSQLAVESGQSGVNEFVIPTSEA